MLKRYYQVFGSLLVVSDAVGLVTAWILAYYLRFYTQIVPVTKGVPPFGRYVTLTLPVLLVWVATFSYFHLYNSSRITRRTNELGATLRAHLVALLLFGAVINAFSEYRFSRVVVGYFAVISGLWVLGTRLGLRNGLRALRRRGRALTSVVVVGDGKSALAVVDRMRRMPELGIRVVGFFTASGEANSDLPAPVLGVYGDLGRKVAALHGLDEVILALPRKDSALQEELLRSLGDTMLRVQLVPDVYDYIVVGCGVEDFDGIPVFALNETPISGWGRALKRVLDVAGAAVALVVFSPVLLVVALLVKATSRGPVFYGQDRMSVDGSTFRMWKFRSMKMNAEKETGAVWAVKDDVRRTPIGAFLRSASLDELPQFWNVLVGDMSLVGPRPERPEFVGKFRHNIPAYMLRHKVKAGITGWAQINGWRGDTSLEKRIEADLYYIRNWTLFLDLKILLLTPFKGLVNKNAY
ncbi:MAG: undecaprenyl-phosphate glucose phosphotransferase [Bdellovibrionales bacterium]|nr:undecaprenyl-phosphate glucose phosphotransferase [Bdellovibrionales bacterium]